MTERPEDSIYRPNAGTWSWTFKTLQTWGENPCGDRAFGSQPWRLEFRSVDNNVTGIITLCLYITHVIQSNPFLNLYLILLRPN